MNLLFICTLNQWRSPTAQEVFKNKPGIIARSAGTASNAKRRVNSTDLEWADIIFVMEKKHKEHLSEKFPEVIKYKKIVNLDIPDLYQFMDPELVEILTLEVGEYLGRS